MRYSEQGYGDMMGVRIVFFFISLILGGLSALTYLGLGMDTMPSVVIPIVIGVIAFLCMLIAIGEAAADILTGFD